MNRRTTRAGLVLTGGGARAAYQVGVVKAVRDILGNPASNPFPILCGTSAGAINAVALAVFADNFTRGVGNLLEVWEHMRCELVYRTDVASILRRGASWLGAMTWISRRNPISLLDNAPLGELLGKFLPFERIQTHIDAGALYAVSVTSSGYTSGQSVSFFQGPPGLEGWERNQRIGAAVALKLEYLLASSALPFIFPAVKLHREYFGDGSMRQIAPVSPALHLGADRVLVVGTGRQVTDQARARSNVYPSLAQIAGHALNSIFLDSLMVDIERMSRINRTLNLIPVDVAAAKGVELRPIKVLFISPSQPIERIAARFVHELPPMVRFVLRPTGAMARSGSNLASYLLFEESFCRALVDLGYQDTASRETEVRAFFEED
ncbi:MAG: Patatin [Betaproteobacteria bacterium RIFCSPLOWO2_02_67_12]|nr:MAG: Patatin [Betaproteobacteria bacterium RIFCSPLOWO2_02_67_12]OGA26780.1 MAG: Patatin [Betaproteobacteria bacterium RIFCSPLOWO2_02_FULL_68_150]OGA55055.1 MAG: Patatin [Betaproteobacteria bacterium RIFCSPLOWO2_12_FULL_67_28]